MKKKIKFDVFDKFSRVMIKHLIRQVMDNNIDINAAARRIKWVVLIELAMTTKRWGTVVDVVQMLRKKGK